MVIEIGLFVPNPVFISEFKTCGQLTGGNLTFSATEMYDSNIALTAGGENLPFGPENE